MPEPKEPKKFDFTYTPPPPLPELPAPALPYRPATRVHPAKIVLIGAGGIAAQHLTAYKKAGYEVAAICDVRRASAEELRDRFYPEAKVFEDYRRALEEMPALDVADITTHPEVRHDIIRDALLAGKHVLSQKPFTTNLDKGEELRALADEKGLKLAVNHNARWAPHFRYAALLARGGHAGALQGVHMGVSWDHTWIKDMPFENIRHCILYDFGIHWFDMLNVFMNGEKAERVHASTARSVGQDVRPPMLGQVSVEYKNAQATLTFEGGCPFGGNDRLLLVGDKGTVESVGPNSNEQILRFRGGKGTFSPTLEGRWFTDGFHGAMAELLSAIAEEREPENGARSALGSLALCFAALASADAGRPVVPGEAKTLPPN